MTDTSWHQHGGGALPADVYGDDILSVWPIGVEAPLEMYARDIDWSRSFRWRMCEAEEGVDYEATTTAPSLLTKAATIMAERGRQYDKPDGERSMGRAVAAFNAITGRELTEAEGWLLLQVLKDVRQWQREGYHADSAEDCIAYAALKAEALATGKNV